MWAALAPVLKFIGGIISDILSKLITTPATISVEETEGPLESTDVNSSRDDLLSQHSGMFDRP